MLSLENVKVTPGRHFWFVFVSVQELPGNWLSCEMQEGYFELRLKSLFGRDMHRSTISFRGLEVWREVY